MRVPLVDLVAQNAEVGDDIRRSLDDVFAKAAFIGGPDVAEFEREYADLVGAAHCVGVGNGTDALELAFRAVGVTAGGEVIVPANTFIATAEAVSRIGARPVFVDVDPEHLLIDPRAVESVISHRTQAIAPVHLFGQVAPVAAIRSVATAAGIPVVEDAAQAQGATSSDGRAGSLATIAATSFYPGKNLGAAGDGGAVTTDDAELARIVRVLSSHGSEHKYVHERIGVNSRLDTIQAAVLRVKLRLLGDWNERRRAAADRYTTLLRDVSGVTTPSSAKGNCDVWHLYVIRVDDRNRVLERLNAAGIGAGIHYPTPLHLTQAYGNEGFGPGAFPVAEEAARRILSLPIYPHITVEQQEYVAEKLVEAVR